MSIAISRGNSSSSLFCDSGSSRDSAEGLFSAFLIFLSFLRFFASFFLSFLLRLRFESLAADLTIVEDKV
jgi:hypothetical protein